MAWTSSDSSGDELFSFRFGGQKSDCSRTTASEQVVMATFDWRKIWIHSVITILLACVRLNGWPIGLKPRMRLGPRFDAGALGCESLMNRSLTRRSFLSSASLLSSSLGAGGVATLGRLAPLRADEAKPMSDRLRASDDVERLVRQIDRTSRENAVEWMVGQLQSGVSYRSLLSAVFVAAGRFNMSPHKVLMVNSAHRLSLDMPPDQMLLPMFWALDTLLHDRDGGLRYDAFELTAVPASAAEPELTRAMKRFDSERATSAMLTLSRSIGTRPAMSRLWRYAGRDFSFIGHRAIAMSNSWRVLESIGWENAEPMFEFVIRQLNGGKWEHWCHDENVARSREIGKLPPAWAGTKSNPVATGELLETFRKEDHFSACKHAYELLAGGEAQAAAIWDAIYLIGGEFMMSYPTADYIRAAPLHTNTSSEALRVAFDRCGSPEVRLYTLLQAVAWAGNFFSVGRERDQLRPIKITEIPDAEIPEDAGEAVEAIFATQPRQRYVAEDLSKSRGVIGSREEMDRASQMAFAFARRHRYHGEFLSMARSVTALKATQNAHDVKFPAAIFDTYRRISREWRPHIIAASMHHLHSSKMVDNAATRQAKELLG